MWVIYKYVGRIGLDAHGRRLLNRPPQGTGPSRRAGVLPWMWRCTWRRTSPLTFPLPLEGSQGCCTVYARSLWPVGAYTDSSRSSMTLRYVNANTSYCEQCEQSVPNAHVRYHTHEH